MLERTACALDPEHGDLLLRLEVGFPANGRTINARELEKILFDLLPRCVEESLLYRNLDGKRLQEAADLAEDQQDIRRQLPPWACAPLWPTAASCPGPPASPPCP